MAIKSNNPAFQRMDGFNGEEQRRQRRTPATARRRRWSTGAGARQRHRRPADRPPPTRSPGTDGPMTIDSTVQKTGITLGVLVLAAAVTWLVTPAVDRPVAT